MKSINEDVSITKDEAKSRQWRPMDCLLFITQPAIVRGGTTHVLYNLSPYIISIFSSQSDPTKMNYMR